jgi:hypothetical protein
VHFVELVVTAGIYFNDHEKDQRTCSMSECSRVRSDRTDPRRFGLVLATIGALNACHLSTPDPSQLSAQAADGKVSDGVRHDGEAHPSLDRSGVQRLTFPATKDTYTKESSKAENKGGESTLDIDQSDTGTERKYGFIGFEVKGVQSPIRSATLRLYVSGGSQDGPEVHSVSATWSESDLTWANQPAPGALIVDLGKVSSGWLEVDVTKVITGNGPWAFALVPTSSDGTDIKTRESGSGPELVLVAGGP